MTLVEDTSVAPRPLTCSDRTGERNSKVRGRYLSKRASMVSHRVGFRSGILCSHCIRTSFQLMVSWDIATRAVLARRDEVRAEESVNWRTMETLVS